ncbi:MAG: hypothetical protein AB1567_00530 [bacterium]
MKKKKGYEKSIHHQATKEGEKGALCSDCHGSHEIKPADYPNSFVYKVYIFYRRVVTAIIKFIRFIKRTFMEKLLLKKG